MINQLLAEGLSAEAARAGAQSYWGYAVSAAGIVVLVLAPVLGAIADAVKNRMRYIWAFSALYVIGSLGLWTASPDDFPAFQVAVFFGLGLVAVELTTVFTNAILPDLGSKEEIGKVSGFGMSWGYVGGLVSLLIMLVFFVDNSDGKTLFGNDPLFGLDGSAREGSRFVGPFTAIWFILSMIPFFLWVREDPKPAGPRVRILDAMKDLGRTIKSLPKRPSLFAYLGSSMCYRDALMGIYTFGGVYAFGVLGWEAQNMGIFGILGLLSGITFSYLGGFVDMRKGPKPVIRGAIFGLIVVCLVIFSVSRETVLWFDVGPDSNLPDMIFYVCGVVLGATGGVLQSASRTMMVRQSDPERMTEAFGLYALSGKATTWLAPLSIAVVTDMSGSQRFGLLPIIVLLILGLVLLGWVRAD